MNTGHLKSYAPQARKDFIASVTARANLLGLSEAKGVLQVADSQVSGDLVMIAGRPWPLKINEQRNKLIARMKLHGFSQTVESVAYAWFNRLAALRFMEVHDYLGHGRRVLSNPQGGLPEVLAHALDLAESNALPGLSVESVRELRLANRDPELYRLILIAQCNALHQAMPFLFEPLGDETELMLPENLLLTDSMVAKLVQSIPEEDWRQIEIIGWLYQFYISEKKDQVIGKVVKSEDIPAATQLFTPNWIVKYLVQNSLGAQWLATYPDSPLKAQMEYYIEPAGQTNEVNAQLAAITSDALNPEELTLIDPACGSGHILVEAYDLFKAIYLERGYQQRDIPKLILERNLFGLDIDERAAQLTGFALMMKGRADDRRLFERGMQLNAIALQNSTGFDVDVVANGMKLDDYGLTKGDLTALKRLFEHAATFGSLVQVPERLSKSLPALRQLGGATSHDLFVSEALKRLVPLVQQAEMLSARYDAVVSNPPYLGSRGMNAQVKGFLKSAYKAGTANLYAAFIMRCIEMASRCGRVAMITLHSWMFLPFYEDVRKNVLRHTAIGSVAHLGAHAFKEISGEVVQAAAFTLSRVECLGHIPTFVRLVDAESDQKRTSFHDSERWYARCSQSEFDKLPGEPIAYWLSEKVQDLFESAPSLRHYAVTASGLQTSDNDRFLRRWFEAALDQICFTATDRPSSIGSGARWFPYNKGGGHRRWYGNHEYVVDWENDGEELFRFASELYGSPTRIIKNTAYYFREGFTWSVTGSAPFAPRYMPSGFIFDVKGSSGFLLDAETTILRLLGYLSASITPYLLAALNPTQDVQVGNIAALPLPYDQLPTETDKLAQELISAHKIDWDSTETSWGFQSIPLLSVISERPGILESNYTAWIAYNRDTIAKIQCLEEENNRLFIHAFGLQEELTPDVPVAELTLTVNPAYRYGGKLTKEEQWNRFRQDTCEELVSYIIGCMMGRFSLDAPGLIYAHAGNLGFDTSRYIRFPADADGIVPLTDDLWFEDDAALRVREFLLAVWGVDSLEQNTAWLAEQLGRKPSESSEEAIRRYLADKFFKDHLQTYKKRPIYWLFSSGKHGAFKALVYLHRYNAGTLSRIRAEYVVPLTGKMQARIEQLERDVAAATSTAVRNRANKQVESLRKKHLELLAFDEQLRHYADMRIELDLDDGVKVNYGKFGDLLAEVKAVVGTKDED